MHGTARATRMQICTASNEGLGYSAALMMMLEWQFFFGVLDGDGTLADFIFVEDGRDVFLDASRPVGCFIVLVLLLLILLLLDSMMMIFFYFFK